GHLRAESLVPAIRQRPAGTWAERTAETAVALRGPAAPYATIATKIGDASIIPAVVNAFIVAAAIASVGAPPSSAEIYRPWCVQYFGGLSGGTSCTFSSYDQCMQTARGNGAYCYQNPWYSQYGGAAPEPGERRPARPR